MLSLQENCLNTIKRNFERIYCAYLITKDLKDKLKYEFLRKKFSLEIAEELHESFNVHKYLDFVVNKYLRYLDTEWFICVSWENILKKFSEVGPCLENVHFINSEHSWEDVICQLPNLLFVSFDCVEDSHIKMIAQYCRKIQSITVATISWNKFSENGLRPIGVKVNNEYPCPELRELIIKTIRKREHHVLDKCVGFLVRNLPFLENVEYSNLSSVLYSLHKDEINVLNQINPYSLTKLEFPGKSYVDKYSLYVDFKNDLDVLTICVLMCPNLKTFSCMLKSEGQRMLEICSKLSKLEDLALFNNTHEELDFDKFLKLRGSSLTSLQIRHFTLHVSSLLNNCNKLTRLHIDNIDFLKDKEDKYAKADLPKLKDLTFYLIQEVQDDMDVNYEAEVISILSASPNLERLQFKYCETLLHSPHIMAAILKSCERNTLQFISFRHFGDVDEQFVKNVLVTCSSLKILDLQGCNFLTNRMDSDNENDSLRVLTKSLPNRPSILFHYPDSDSDDNYFSD